MSGVFPKQEERSVLCAKLTTPRQASAVQTSSVVNSITLDVSAARSLRMNRRFCVRYTSVLRVRPSAKLSLPVCSVSVFN